MPISRARAAIRESETGARRKVAIWSHANRRRPGRSGMAQCYFGADAPRHLDEKDRTEDSRQPRVNPVTPPETEIRARWRHENERGGPLGTLRGEPKRDKAAEGYAADRRSRQVAIVEHGIDLVDEVVQASRRIEPPATSRSPQRGKVMTRNDSASASIAGRILPSALDAGNQRSSAAPRS